MSDPKASAASGLEPGVVLFDYYDEEVIAEFADQLGVALPIGRAIEEQSSTTAGVNLVILPFGAKLGRSRGWRESETYPPASKGRTLVALLAEMRARLKRIATDPHAPGLALTAARTAAAHHLLIVSEGWWHLYEAPLRLRLTHLAHRSTGRPEPVPHELTLECRITGTDRTVLTLRGRDRLSEHDHVFAGVLGQGSGWAEAEQRFTGTALAVFHRVAGDEGFR